MTDFRTIGRKLSRQRYQRGSLEKTGKRAKVWKGHWYVYEQTPTGEKRKHKSRVIGRVADLTKAEAQKKLDELIARGNGAAPKIDGKVLLGDFIRDVYLPTKEGEWAHNTHRNALSIIRMHIEPEFGLVPLEEIKKVRVVKFLAAQAKAGYSRATLSSVRAILHGIFEEALENDYLDRKNPARRVKNPVKPSKGAQPTLTMAQVRSVLTSLTGRTRLLFSLMLLCGLRIGEVLSLRWNDVQGDILCVDESVDQKGTKCTKTDTVRVVPLSASLQQWIAEIKTAAVFCRDEDFIFCARDGHGPIRRQTADFNYQQPAREATGIENLDFRLCRRTFATLLKPFAHTRDIQAMLGHASPQTTEKHYIQPVEESQRAAQASLEAAVWKQ
jgi:integrase